MDEEVNTYQEIFQTSDKQRYLQLVLSVAIILIMVMVFVFVAKQNGSLGILSPNKQSQNQPDKTPFELAVEQRIAENGDPSTLSAAEEAWLQATFSDNNGLLDDESRGQALETLRLRLIENGDLSVLTKAELEAQAPFVEEMSKAQEVTAQEVSEVIEKRIAENGDPSILTLEEQSFIDMTSGEAEEEPVLVE
ncbi:hypothetical protein H6781_02485 [Candidatus Nomurabacteria bacterium]|nr:hypothetical protein [Candidatus Nomurabacteria bacterium]